MGKIEGIFRFKYIELLDGGYERDSELLIDTKDIVRSIGKFGETRNLVDLVVTKINNK